MSQPSAGKMSTDGPSKATRRERAPSSSKNFRVDCALLKYGHGPFITYGKLIVCRVPEIDIWLGLQLEFPLGPKQAANEEAGFGVRHRYDRGISNGTVVQYDYHVIKVRFPLGGQGAKFIGKADAEWSELFPKIDPERLSLVSVILKGNDEVTVTGFGMPFANGSDSGVEAIVNANKPIANGVTLLDVMRLNEFHLVVPFPSHELQKRFYGIQLVPPFSYPYGSEHGWDRDRYEKLLQATKGQTQFPPAYTYSDDNSHLAVVTQANVQDVLWLANKADEIAEIRFPAYFVPINPDTTGYAKMFYLVMPLFQGFRDRFDTAWRRLAKNDSFRVLLFNSREDREHAADWDCMIVDYPGSIDLLNAHPTDKYELVLRVRHKALKEAEIKDKMDLHRALLRGNGFYGWMTRAGFGTGLSAAKSAVSLNPTLRALPVFNFLGFGNVEYANALIQEALPEDHVRFRQYLSDRPLGLGLITAASLGPILCSGPSNISVDNFASRLDCLTSSVCDRYNKGKEQDDANRKRYCLVVRAYKTVDEEKAFMHLLEHPNDGDDAAPSRAWSGKFWWRLHLSPTFWLLVLLRSQAKGTRKLRPDDSPALHEMRQEIDRDARLKDLRAVATGQISWEEYRATGKDLSAAARHYMSRIVNSADLFCTIPAMTHNVEFYRVWKNERAKGVAADEAANMNRADLYCVWGNTLLPCFLGGGPKLKMLAGNEKDSLHVHDSNISPLEFLQVAGIPTYRLRVQLPTYV
ncbi:hypothetical protein M434DRAFT_382598 [Hypoxylon sp. CO27-5]|nr:hypothetical protein M434DRAFT_382598 [Hypoxylon sp. CO27-5]